MLSNCFDRGIIVWLVNIKINFVFVEVGVLKDVNLVNVVGWLFGVGVFFFIIWIVVSRVFIFGKIVLGFFWVFIFKEGDVLWVVFFWFIIWVIGLLVGSFILIVGFISCGSLKLDIWILVCELFNVFIMFSFSIWVGFCFFGVFVGVKLVVFGWKVDMGVEVKWGVVF